MFIFDEPDCCNQPRWTESRAEGSVLQVSSDALASVNPVGRVSFPLKVRQRGQKNPTVIDL